MYEYHCPLNDGSQECTLGFKKGLLEKKVVHPEDERPVFACKRSTGCY
jgi:hypothetical protein